MSGYLRFSRTGFKPFDDVIEMLEAAGDAYHHTGQWADDGWGGEKPYTDQIDGKIIEASAQYQHKEAELAYLRARLEKAERDAEICRSERDHSASCKENAVRILMEIYALLYPPMFKTEDGRIMAFRPKYPNPHEVLQALSDRIRAIPDELGAMDAAIAKGRTA